MKYFINYYEINKKMSIGFMNRQISVLNYSDVQNLYAFYYIAYTLLLYFSYITCLMSK